MIYKYTKKMGRNTIISIFYRYIFVGKEKNFYLRIVFRNLDNFKNYQQKK